MALDIMAMPMPKKPMPGMDDMKEGSPEEESMESPEEEGGEKEEGKDKLTDEEAAEAMAPVSDKQLVQEAKARGLV